MKPRNKIYQSVRLLGRIEKNTRFCKECCSWLFSCEDKIFSIWIFLRSISRQKYWLMIVRNVWLVSVRFPSKRFLELITEKTETEEEDISSKLTWYISTNDDRHKTAHILRIHRSFYRYIIKHKLDQDHVMLVDGSIICKARNDLFYFDPNLTLRKTRFQTKMKEFEIFRYGS